jgi:geranylgeranyl diphosphate synthase type I
MAVRTRADYLDQITTLEEPPPLDRDVEDFLREVDRRLVPHLKRALARVPQVEPLRRGMTHQITSGGKRIRAALCAASCGLFGTVYERALPFAAAIEHMQNFTLVHDDISDGDEHRRAQESIWKQFGVPHGINIGDTFVPLAALEILESPYADALKLTLLSLVASFGLEMVEGQTLDLNMRTQRDATEDDYLECTRKKTGSFLAMATVGGGAIGGADDRSLNRLRDYARLAGVAFQIKDDILDLDGTKGRSIGSDILEGKRTLLVIRAAQRCSTLERRHLFSVLDRPRDRKGSRDIQWVFDLYAKTGAREHAEFTAAHLIDEACDYLLDLPESGAKYRLLRLSTYLSRRSH